MPAADLYKSAATGMTTRMSAVVMLSMNRMPRPTPRILASLSPLLDMRQATQASGLRNSHLPRAMTPRP